MTNQKISTCCDIIREAWYQRQMLVRADGSLVRQLKSICRRLCGGDKVAGTKLYKKLRRAKVDSPDLLALGANIVLLKHEIATQLALDEQERMLYSHVRSLPVWKWIESIRGVSENALASVVGEAGDLNNYANPGKLWKRMGLALVEYKGEQVRQRKALDKKLATLMGYSPKRRAAMYIIGGNIIKARKGATGVAADLLAYYEAEKAKASGKGLSKAHSHYRAQGHMEKRFLKLLWREWTGRGQEWVEPQRLAA